MMLTIGSLCNDAFQCSAFYALNCRFITEKLIGMYNWSWQN